MKLSDTTRRAYEWVVKTAEERRVVDALVNLVSGIGTSRDKSTFNMYVDSPLLTVWDLETLFKDSGLARKIITKLPKDALRGGFEVRRKGGSPEGEDKELEALKARLKELKVTDLLFRAACWGRLFGGAGIVMSVTGGGGPRTELDPEDITGIDLLRVCDRQDFSPAFYGPDGATERWWWTRVSKGGGAVGVPTIEIHTSRVLWFGGALTTDRGRARNQYWDHSILQAIFNTLLSYDAYWASLDGQVADASQAVYHLSGFLKALAENQGATFGALAKRLAIMDRGRSNSKALVLDAGDKDGNGREEFTVVERASLANMDALTDRYAAKLATDVAEYPVAVLFEQAAAGTNATGESELIRYFNNVDEYRAQQLEPPAMFLVQAIAREVGIDDPENLEIVWPELWKPKPLDIASAEKMRVDAAVALCGQGIVLEEEVALSLDKMCPNLNLTLDTQARREALEAGLDEVRERTVMDPSEGEIKAQTAVKAAGAPPPAAKASGRAVKAKTNPATSKNSPAK